MIMHEFWNSRPSDWHGGAAFAPPSDTPLADGFQLVAADLAGFGSSPPQAGAGTPKGP